MYWCSDRNLFKMQDAEFAANVTPGYLHSLCARGLLALDPADSIHVGTGRTAWVSYRTTTALAVIGALRSMEMPLVLAVQAADAFVAHARRMAEAGSRSLFDEGRTLLMISFGLQAGETVFAGAGVVNHRPNSGMEFVTGPRQLFLDVGEVIAAMDARIEVIAYREGPEIPSGAAASGSKLRCEGVAGPARV